MVSSTGAQVPLRRDAVLVWSWGRLVMEAGFYGCEVLVLDTGGCDVERYGFGHDDTLTVVMINIQW